MARTPIRDVRSAFVVSLVSVVWTVASGGAAIALGIASGSAVLVAFGAIGFVDAAGSVALAYHFHHGLRHDELSDEIEKLAHRVVLMGLVTVGAAAFAGGLFRLFTKQSAHASAAGIVLAAVSLVVMPLLARAKRRVSSRLGSAAMNADAMQTQFCTYLSAILLAGLLLNALAGWWWADPVAALVMVPLMLREGVEGIQGKTCCAHCA